MAAAQVAVRLAPGEYFVGDARHRVHTLLGSCVSITLWQRERRVGAMSHFLLAKRAGQGGAALDARYGDEAMSLMLQGLAACGVQPETCEAKLFGGGNMFPETTSPMPLAIGQRNGIGAQALLDAHGIALVSHSLFGVGHRTIVFDIATGDVWARHTPRAPCKTMGAGA